jgi:hypothetical protein
VIIDVAYHEGIIDARNLEVREDAVMEVMDFYNLSVILGEKFADFAYDAASVLAVDHKEAAEVI